MSGLSKAEKILLEEIRQGSGEGWSQLVDRYQGRLLAFARSKLRQSNDAEDLVQETFVSFLKGLPAFREQSTLETYLFAICRRKIINHYRGKHNSICLLQDVMQTSSEAGSDHAASEILAPDPTASWYARRAEARDLQHEALSSALHDLVSSLKKSLNFRDLQIVEMLFYCQLRNKDIADIAKVTANHVALIKHRCMKQIQEGVSQNLKDSPAALPPDDMLSTIWQEQRLSCLKRSTIGAYLLGTLTEPWQGYVTFHLERLGCEFCRANLDDLRHQSSDTEPHILRDRILNSTIGFLSKPSG